MFILVASLSMSGLASCILGILASMFIKVKKKPLCIGLVSSAILFFVAMVISPFSSEATGLDTLSILAGFSAPPIAVIYYLLFSYRKMNPDKEVARTKRRLEREDGKQKAKTTKCFEVQKAQIVPSDKVNECITNRKKRMKFLPVIVIILFVFVLVVANPVIGGHSKNRLSDKANETQNYGSVESGADISVDDIKSYKFGHVLVEALNSIGATNIKTAICEVSNSYGTTFKVETDGPVLWVSLKQAYFGEEWYVAWIKDYDSKKLYYCNESEKYTPSGLLEESIYSFKTGEILEQADREAVGAYYNQLEEDRDKEAERQEQQERDYANELFREIRSAYKNNELSADDTYKGNRYTIIGQFDGVSEDGIFNTLLNEINVTVKIMDGNTPCYVFCSFDSDTWREKLTELNKGDEMIIEGECYSWGSWSDCTLKN